MLRIPRRIAPAALLAFSLVFASSARAQDAKELEKPEHEESAAGHSHGMSEIHGGRVTMTPTHHFEVLFAPTEARVYCYDKVQQSIEPSDDVTVGMVLESRTGDDVPLTMKYVQPDPEKGHTLGYFSAAYDFSAVEENAMKAVLRIAGLTEKPIEFKTNVTVSEPASYACPMNDSAPVAEPMACPKCGMKMVRQESAKKGGAGSRCRPEWLSQYLLAPENLRYASEGRRPRIRMPRIEGRQDARDLAAYLHTLRDTVRVPNVAGAEAWADDSVLVANGAGLFDQYQCRGCHVLDGRGNEVGPALDGVADRRPASYVMALLRAPQTVIPGTPMEDKHLWNEEAHALSAYLMTLRSPSKTSNSYK